ncbi:MAG: orotate phosphoribosyltransferase [Halanaerobiaceae bacterium]
MEKYKEEFIEFMVEAGVLKFGEFTTKSGRKAPYFVNTGNYKTGEQISKLGDFYAESINNSLNEDYDVLFGPAYKGIPLVVTTASSLYRKYSESVSISFNRKERKDHGEGGSIIGHLPEDNEKILIIEDVVTAGTSVRESVALLDKIADVNIFALIISVDRMEKGSSGKSATQELEEEYGIKTYSIVNIKEIVEYLHNKKVNGEVIIDDEMKDNIENYLSKYGA